MNEAANKDARWISDAAPDVEVSRRSTAIVVLLLAVPMAATIAYGAVDAVAFGALALMVAAIVLLWMWDAWSLGELRFSTSDLQLPIFGLILIGIFQLLPFNDAGLSPPVLNVEASRSSSLDPFATKMFVGQLVVFLAFFAAALSFLNSSKRVRNVAVAIIIFGAAMAFFGILQRLSNPEAIYGLRPTPQAIPFGPLVNQHHFAAFMEMTSGLSLALIFGAGLKRDRKLLLWIAAVVMGIALVFTGSRGGVISYAGVVLFVLAAGYFFSRRDEIGKASIDSTGRFSLVAGCTALLLIIAGLVFYLGGGDSLLRGIGVDAGSATDVSSGRIRFWGIALKIFAANPVLGCGLDAFGVAFTRFDTENGLYRVEQAHNEYLQTLAEAGVLGLLFVLAFLFLLFRNGLRSIARSKDRLLKSISTGALAGCFGIAIHSFFDFPLRTPSNAFFFLLLCVLATTAGAVGKRKASVIEP